MTARLATAASATVLVAAGLTAATAGPPAVGTTEGDTLARVVVPEIRMDTAAVRVTPVSGGSTMIALGTHPVQVRPESVTLEGRAPFTAADVRSLTTVGKVGIETGWGDRSCDKTRWALASGTMSDKGSGTPKAVGAATETLPAGEDRVLCTRLTSALADDAFVQGFAGRSVVAHTRWRSELAPPATWFATATTDTLLRVPLPAPQAASRPCPASRRGDITVAWTWPSPKATPIEGATGIARWSVQARPHGGGDWTEVAGRTGSAPRSILLSPRHLRDAGLKPGAVDVIVQALPLARADAPRADSAHIWTVTMPARGALTCAGVVDNPGTTFHPEES